MPHTVNLHTAVRVQDDVSFLLYEVFTDVVRQRGWSEDKPALSPVLPFVPLFHHVALHKQSRRVILIITVLD